MKTSTTADQLRPIAEQFTKKMAEVLDARVNAVISSTIQSVTAALDRAIGEVREGGAEVVDLAPAAPTPTKKPRKLAAGFRNLAKKIKAERPKSAPAAQALELTARGEPRKRAPRSCSKCGAIGKRADGCGRTHNIKPTAAPASDNSEDEGAADVAPVLKEPRRKRGPKPLVEEERVIPHAALVAMLHADRMNNLVGDAGGMVVRAEREPSLVGHAETTREVCHVHGWVGRVAFERDGHQRCDSAGVPCRSCRRGEYAAGTGFCKRCNGTGVEPVDTDPDADDDVPNTGGIEPEPRLVAIPGYELAWSETSRNTRRVAPRSETIAIKQLTRAELRAGEIEVELAGPPVDEQRPRTRAECVNGPRPCPWVACRHHLYLDVDPERGSIKFNFAGHEPEEMIESCALDIADRGPHILENVANVLNLTRERARQIETRALSNLRAHAMDAGITAEDAANTGVDDTEAA